MLSQHFQPSAIDGDVVERNEDVVAAPEKINASPYDEAWLVRIRVADSLCKGNQACSEC